MTHAVLEVPVPQVLDQASSGGHRQQLHPPADGEQRDPGSHGGLDQVELLGVPERVAADVGPTREHQGIDHVEHLGCRVAGQHDRSAAGRADPLDVRRGGAGHRQLTEGPLDLVAVADDPDDGHNAATTTVMLRATPAR